jgi:hypothetical protein
MPTAVLKNRLLDLTDRQFRESRYGVSRFSDLLRQLDLVDLVGSGATQAAQLQPSVVEAIEADSGTASNPSPRHVGGFRIRPDLWNAVMDYTNAKAWRWNSATHEAEEVGETEDVQQSEILPTITRDDLLAWRSHFATSWENLSDGPGDEERINEWANNESSSTKLPPPVRSAWFAYLTEAVRSRLIEWFLQHDLNPPHDLALQRNSNRGISDKQLDELRSWVTACVMRMTREELESLVLPVRSVRRIAQEP